MYLLSLSEEQRSEVKLNPSNKMFNFGAGMKVPSESVCIILWVLVGRPVLITTGVVKSDILMLLSRQAMKKAGVKINTSNYFSSILALQFSWIQQPLVLFLSHAMNMRAIFSSVIFGWDLRFCLREANTITSCWEDNIERRDINYIKRDHMRLSKSMHLPNPRLYGFGIFQIAAGVHSLPSLTTYWHEFNLYYSMDE